jgi:hypothetical protein
MVHLCSQVESGLVPALPRPVWHEKKGRARVNLNFWTTAASKSVGGHSNRVSSVARHAEASSAWH